MTLLFDNIRFALAAIWANKLRTLLTMLGIIIGVFSVIILVSIGNGVQKEFAGAVETLGGNIAAVVSGDVEDGESSPGSYLSLSSLTLGDTEAVQAIDHVRAAAPLMIVPGAIAPPAADPYTPLTLATNEQMATVVGLQAREGRFFTEEDLSNAAPVILVGRDAAETDFEGSPIGQTVTVLETSFEVIGVVETDNELLGGGDGEGSFLNEQFPDIHSGYLLPISTVEGILDTLNIFRIMIDFATPEAVIPGVAAVEEILLERHKGIKDFSVLTTDDILELFDQFFGILTNAVAGIAAISLLVGGIGIMNIMLVSVTERTREIGIRKAVGASNSSILFQFLVEAATVSFAGGAIGLVLAIAVGSVITERFGIPTDVTVGSVALALGMSVGVGVLFGLLPATQASRKDPIDALRYE